MFGEPLVQVVGVVTLLHEVPLPAAQRRKMINQANQVG
jgi:hypothetical protein